MFKYVSGLNHPEFTRYLVSENRKYTIEESYLYNLLEGKDIDDTAENGRVVWWYPRYAI
jgi:hypothetical protein